MDKFETMLLEVADPDQGKRRDLYNYDNPASCDICSSSFEKSTFFIDGGVEGTMAWANMCPKCFASRGQGIAWGKGQLYMRQDDGSWVMAAGFPPEDN